MKSHVARSLHHWIRALILSGFSLYITYLVRVEHINYYIAPRMELYVKLSAVGLYAVAAYQVFLALKAAWGETKPCGCGDIEPSRSPIAYVLFIVPLLLGFMLPDAAMDSNIAAKKGMNLASSNTIKSAVDAAQTTPGPSNKSDISPGPVPNGTDTNSKAVPDTNPGNNTAAGPKPQTDAEIQAMFQTEEFYEDYAKLGMKLYKQKNIEVKEDIFIETVTTLDLYKDNFIGKEIEITGFVYRDEFMTKEQFAISRFQMQCCSADASPFGMMVEFGKAANFATDSWVKISGTIGKTKYNSENDIMKIDVKKIEKIKAPKDPYVYPNYEIWNQL